MQALAQDKSWPLALERYRQIFQAAHRLGLKGCTVFRPSPSVGEVLSATPEQPEVVDAKECCLST